MVTFIDAQMSPVNACLRPHLSPKRPHLSPKTTQAHDFINKLLPELIELIEQERRYALFGKYVRVVLALNLPFSILSQGSRLTFLHFVVMFLHKVPEGCELWE